MPRTMTVIVVGLLAGLLDLVPLVLVNAPLFNMLSVMTFWLVTVFVMSQMTVLKNSSLNGLIVSLMLMLPLSLAVAATNPKDFVPMVSMALILGPVCGYCVEKMGKS